MFWMISTFIEARNKLSENNITNYHRNKNNNKKHAIKCCYYNNK